ncbi:MAG: hypothetical protein O2890_11210 [Cyanobacteria bacterium]|nr:hypothetical protein [Cyanobacteriota bacterium]MDA0866962.1 hypothetical protein [Cyanobacteriota bacterium]
MATGAICDGGDRQWLSSSLDQGFDLKIDLKSPATRRRDGIYTQTHQVTP